MNDKFLAVLACDFYKRFLVSSLCFFEYTKEQIGMFVFCVTDTPASIDHAVFEMEYAMPPKPYPEYTQPEKKSHDTSSNINKGFVLIKIIRDDVVFYKPIESNEHAYIDNSKRNIMTKCFGKCFFSDRKLSNEWSEYGSVHKTS